LKIRRQITQLRAADVQLYRLADEAGGGLILLMAVFSPWALGTTQPWAVWTMTCAAGLLGALLLLKLFTRAALGRPRPGESKKNTALPCPRRDGRAGVADRCAAAVLSGQRAERRRHLRPGKTFFHLPSAPRLAAAQF
jgi:hypothetical protein